MSLAAITLAASLALGSSEHVLPDPEGFRPELWSPDGNSLVLTRDLRDIRILDTKSGLLWDVYSMTEPSPVHIPMAWDSTGTALRFLDYNAEAIRTYDLESGALSAFHVRDPFLMREMWRGIEAPETRAIVWWDPKRLKWELLPRQLMPNTIPPGEIEAMSIDRPGEWIVSRLSEFTAVGPTGSHGVAPSPRSTMHAILPGRSITWQPDAPRLWYVESDAYQPDQLYLLDVPAFWVLGAEHIQSLGPLTGGEVLHIALAPGGKRVAWLTATGIYTADIE